MSVCMCLLLILFRIYKVKAPFIRSWFGICFFLQSYVMLFHHDLSFAFVFYSGTV